MLSITRLQTYFRHSAQQQYEAISVPFFTLFFHHTDTNTYFNYAIPDEPCGEGLEVSLSLLKKAFAEHGRRPRFEFIEEFAPLLAPALRTAGFAEEARQQLMICTAETSRPAPEVFGVTLAQLSSSSTISEMQEFLTIQRRGFDFHNTEVITQGETEQFLRVMGEGKAFMARLEGEAVGAGMYTAPFDGLSEVLGLATLEPFRRREIATALTSLAFQIALEHGVEVVCLTAEDKRAERIYERVGFVRYATMLAYINSERT